MTKLVIVRCNPFWNPATSTPRYFTSIVATPERWTQAAAAQQRLRDFADSSLLLKPISSWAQPYVHLRMFAGQPDPGDEAHFTIAFERGGRRGVIDGWLVDDPYNRGVAVRMQIRGDEAAVQP